MASAFGNRKFGGKKFGGKKKGGNLFGKSAPAARKRMQDKQEQADSPSRSAANKTKVGTPKKKFTTNKVAGGRSTPGQKTFKKTSAGTNRKAVNPSGNSRPSATPKKRVTGGVETIRDTKAATARSKTKRQEMNKGLASPAQSPKNLTIPSPPKKKPARASSRPSNQNRQRRRVNKFGQAVFDPGR